MSCIFADFHVNDVSFLIFKSKMAANILVSQQDRKDLDKYIRFFVIKAVQIIVQSRLGERKHTHCRTVSAGSDWVNQFSYKRSVIQSPRLSVFGFYISGVYFMFSYRISMKNLFLFYLHPALCGKHSSSNIHFIWLTHDVLIRPSFFKYLIQFKMLTADYLPT